MQTRLQGCIQNCAKTNMLVKLCVGDYLTYDGFVNGADGLF
jgi:hypothetical protein